MEPPAKRPRVGHAPWDDDDDEANDDELTLSATQFDARQDPMYQLDRKRAKSAFKLKSRFEDIFEKYGRDFEGVGDEIDLHTGEIVVDNGHVQSLEDQDQNKSEDEEEETRLQQDRDSAKRSKATHLVQGRPASCGAAHMHHGNRQQPLSAVPNIALAPQVFGAPQPLYFGNSPTDPAWQTPEMQTSFPQRGLGYAPPFSRDYQPLLGAANFTTGFGIANAQGQPYRRIAVAKDIGPPAPAMLDADIEDQGSDTEDGDVLLECSRTPPKKLSKARAVLFAGLEEPPNDHKTEARAEISAETSQTLRRRGRPRKQPDSPSGSAAAGNTSLLRSTQQLDPPDQARVDTNCSRPGSKYRIPTNDLEAAQDIVKTKAPIQEQTPVTDDSSDSQSRRSSRVRKQIQFYGKINWMTPRERRIKAERGMTPPPETDGELFRNELPQNESSSRPASSQEIRDAETPNLDQSNVEAVHVSQTAELGRLPIQTLDVINTILDSSCHTNRTVPDSEKTGASCLRRTVTGPQAPSPSLPIPSRIGQEDAFTSQSNPVEIAEKKGEYFLSNSLLAEDPEGLQDPEDINQGCASREVASAEPKEGLTTPESIKAYVFEPGPQEESEPCDEADVSIELGEATSYCSGPQEVTNGAIDEQSPEPTQSSKEETTIQVRRELGRLNLYEAHDTVGSSVSGFQAEKDCRVPSTDLPLRPCSEKRAASSDPDTHGRQEMEPISAKDTPQSLYQGGGKSPSSKSKSKSHPRTPKTIRTLASLIPDASDDEDELSILSSSVARTAGSNASLRASFIRGISQASPTTTSTPRRSRQHSVILSTPRHLELGRASSRHGSPSLPRLPATDTRAIRHGLKRKQSSFGLAQSSPLARTVLLKTPQKDNNCSSVWGSRAGSPANSLVGTAGGTMRRCGEDGMIASMVSVVQKQFNEE
ncbi:hypothetical protein SCAR479_05892 [Seiridium cardinale]|uniref:Uncharacterized protein n=1 Tax=Seiridium cardinale TaxID=138064 RepID=A0ABR2XUM4_9PEZI